MRPARTALLTLLTLALAAAGAAADDWPQWLGPQRDGVWREKGLVDKFPAGGPKVRWRAPLGGGYAGPAVADGRVYVTDRVLAAGEKAPASPWGRSKTKGKERVLCLDAADGKVVWKHEYDCTYGLSYPSGPRATPVVHKGKVYTLGAMGDLYCLDAKKGTVVWSKNFPTHYKARVPVWGFSSPPLVDGDKLICLVGGPGSVAVAFDLDTGKEKWKALSLVDTSELGYAPPMIYTVGGTRQLIVWHPEAIVGLDPDTGKVYWEDEFNVRSGLTIPTPRLVGEDKLFLTAFYNGARLYQLTGGKKPTAKLLWQSKGRSEQPKDTDKLHSIMSTPFVQGGHIYGVDSYGELRCLDAKDGKRLWADQSATGYKAPERWANAFLVAHGDRFFLFNERGDLILARLTPKGYKELDKANLLKPTSQLVGGGRGGMPTRKVVWSHPAFANRSVYARNDEEIVCVSLAAGK